MMNEIYTIVSKHLFKKYLLQGEKYLYTREVWQLSPELVLTVMAPMEIMVM